MKDNVRSTWLTSAHRCYVNVCVCECVYTLMLGASIKGLHIES